MNVVAVRRWWQRPTAPLLVIAAVKLAIHLATNGLYGFHTDELYYIISGQHPALGYVDYPPVTPMLAWLNTSIFGISPWTLRLFPALSGAAVVFLTGMCAREMGGGRGVSILASVVALMTPLLLGTWLFQTVEFDLLTWVLQSTCCCASCAPAIGGSSSCSVSTSVSGSRPRRPFWGYVPAPGWRCSCRGICACS